VIHTGLFDRLFGARPKPSGDYQGQWKMLNGYEPHFTTFGGNIYESELVRASIDAIARHISKLAVTTAGAAKPALQNKLKHGPNEFQTWSQFLYRLATILYVHNTAFIAPVYDQYGEPSGVYAVLPERCEIVQYGNDKTPYLRYKFGWGETAAIELEYCGVMTRFQYRSDMFGETNRALYPTMDLIKMQNQGIQEGVKSAATYRFMAQLSNFAKAEDLAKERKRFSEENFSRDAGGGGMLLFPNTYQNIKQIENKPFVVDADQMSVINRAVFDYFGVNEDVLTNKAYGDAWAAFYEGCIEPFAVQFSEVMTRMLFTFREQSQGNFVMATANRLQYMTNADKLNVSAAMMDRGIMSINEVREIWQLPPVEGGDVRIVRGEYYNADDKTGGESDDSENTTAET
jgi:hypothetical protein